MMPKHVGWHHPVDTSDQWDGFNDSGIEHFRGSPILHLAREVNQNALDAGESDVVDVKIRLHKVNTNTVPHVKELKKNLQSCYEAAKNESRKAEVFFKNALDELSKKEISVLEISDYNTSGMVGPSQNGMPFYAFMKAKGQSRKGSDVATGSYGIGKFAPYAVSNVRTIFVSTVYQDDKGKYKQLTQGKSIFMSHDVDGERKQGVGFWGIREKCKPVEGVSTILPKWIQRSNAKSDFPNSKGAKVTVICFDVSDNWQELLAVSIAENFFGAISDGKLRVDIDGKYQLDELLISDFFEQGTIRKLIENMDDEPDRFDNCKNYLTTLQDKTEVIVEESERRQLGLCQLRILIGEGFPKKVCTLRNGMFITDSLSRLKVFSDFKEFVAIIQCQSKKGNALLRAMEPPRHDNFEPDRLPTKPEQREGAKALRDLARWVREMLKRHAKEPVSDVTEIDELRDFLSDEGDEGSGEGIEEINPFGEVVIRAKPIKVRFGLSKKEDEATDDSDGLNGGEGSEGSGDSGGGGGGGAGSGISGGGEGARKSDVSINNVRAVLFGDRSRRVAFTPVFTGKISLRLFEAGADTDYEVFIINADKGTAENGGVTLDVTAGNRCSMNVELDKDFSGALRVVAHEV